MLWQWSTSNKKGVTLYPLKHIININDQAVIKEYRQALLDGAIKKAENIYNANADLADALDHVKVQVAV